MHTLFSEWQMVALHHLGCILVQTHIYLLILWRGLSRVFFNRNLQPKLFQQLCYQQYNFWFNNKYIKYIMVCHIF